MNKICTSIEQSKKLMELGIDVNTADMSLSNVSQKGVNYTESFSASIVPYREINDMMKSISKVWEFYPAWSLSALLEFMNRNDYDMALKYCGSEYTMCFDNGERYKSITKDYAIDAAFEMVCWLKENNKI